MVQRYGMMRAPNWFLLVIAVSVLMLSAAFSVRALRDVPNSRSARSAITWESKQGGVFNPATATACGPLDGTHWICIDMRNGDTLTALDVLTLSNRVSR